MKKRKAAKVSEEKDTIFLYLNFKGILPTKIVYKDIVNYSFKNKLPDVEGLVREFIMSDDDFNSITVTQFFLTLNHHLNFKIGEELE